jgi:hypothetical protein
MAVHIRQGGWIMTRNIIQRVVFTLLLFLVPCLETQASLVYFATMSGPAEDPPNASPGTGTTLVVYDPTAHSLQVDASFSDLLGDTTVAHIHCCTLSPLTGTAGVATPVPTFPGFPAGVTSGTYSQLFDLTLESSFNPAFITANGGTAAGAEATLAAGLAAGKTYFNIHTSMFPGGEIRGFLAPVPVPAAAWLFGSGLLGLIGVARHRAARSYWRSRGASSLNEAIAKSSKF